MEANVFASRCCERARGVETAVEQLAGSTGVAEYARILRQHGVDRPKEFKTAQPARLCAKDVFALLEELRANARENDPQLSLQSGSKEGGVDQSAKSAEAK
jgi:hypothetical protein